MRVGSEELGAGLRVNELVLEDNFFVNIARRFCGSGEKVPLAVEAKSLT